jgi:TonB-linked SusC/RagA family outer membrane protein
MAPIQASAQSQRQYTGIEVDSSIDGIETSAAEVLGQSVENPSAGLNTVISVRLEQATLEEALEQISEKSGVSVVYGSDKVSVGKRIDLEVERSTAREAFDRVLQDTGLQLRTFSEEQFVVIEEREASRKINQFDPVTSAPVEEVSEVRRPIETGQPQIGTITGTVTNAQTRDPLPGVNVVVVGTQQGAATDASGQYTISDVEVGTYTVRASFVGFEDETREGVEVQEGEITEVNFELVESGIALEEVVAVGYGEQRRRDLTGSISDVSTEGVEGVPVTRLEDVLQGRASGVEVIQNSGAPGSGATVRVRGTNSINAGSDPLVVIDGFPGAGDLSSLNPNNIESIQVLKDASATAIYGARGSGGVILVTTKEGVSGDQRINFSTSYGLQEASNTLDLLNAEEFARLANEAHANAGQPTPYENPEGLGSGTDWQDQIFRTSLRQEYQLSVSGGAEDIQYLISGNFVDQEGIIENSFFDRGQLRVNLNGDVSDRLTISNNLSLSRIGENQLGGRAVRNALLSRPTMNVRNNEGNYTKLQVPQLNLENPVAGVEEPKIDNTTFGGLGNVSAEYDITDNLSIRSRVGGEVRNMERKEYIPTTLEEGRPSGGQATVQEQEEIEWVSDNTINYSTVFDERHDIELLAGYTFQKETVDFVQTGVSQFASERLGYNNLSVGSTPSTPQSNIQESTLQSIIFRSNYQFNNKYLLTATGRYDGSSKFGEGNRYGVFPSGSFAWRLSEEGFLQDADYLTNLKLRISYGITGNEDIGTYAARARLSPTSTVFGDEIAVGIEPTRVANPDLKWEETSQLNAGIDATLFEESLSLSADYYSKQTSDLLLAVALPSQTGFGSTIRNIGSVENKGFELSTGLNSNIGDVSWDSNLNITRNMNEVTDLGPNKEIFPGASVGGISSVNDQSIIIREGEPLGSFYGFVLEGLFQSEEEIQNSAQPNAEVGGPRYQDVNNDGKIDDADKQIIGNGQPDFYGSFSNTFRYEGLQLRIQMRGSFGKDVLNTSRLELESVNGAFNNISTVKDRWTKNNRDTNIPKANATGYPFVVTSRFIEDGSYLRLQNINLRYSIPEGWIGSVRNAAVYVNADNIYTFTGYSGYDPEINFQGGSNVAFSIDYNPYPRVRSYTLGIQLGF